eukprot:INCI3151.4.p1 GENE.INCI3151.4~~INCI3151.4.p1  ORF type:complete len:615 (-),score=87.67 INCI3151.4:210-2054(-)
MASVGLLWLGVALVASMPSSVDSQAYMRLKTGSSRPGRSRSTTSTRPPTTHSTARSTSNPAQRTPKAEMAVPVQGFANTPDRTRNAKSRTWTPPPGLDPYSLATARFQAAEQLSPFTFLENEPFKCPEEFLLASTETNNEMGYDTASCFDYCAARAECGYIYTFGSPSRNDFVCEAYSKCNRMFLVNTGTKVGKIYSLADRGVAEDIDGLWIVAPSQSSSGTDTSGWTVNDGSDPIVEELLAEVADMSIGSCSLDYVFDASEVPLHQQLRREEWQTIKKTSPMLVRTVLGRDNDVHLHKETLLKYFGGIMTKAQSEASIAQFGPSDIAASLTMREVLENPDTSKPRLGFDTNIAKMLRFSTNYEKYMPNIITSSLGPPGANAMDIFSIAPTKAGLPMHVHGEAWLHLLGGQKLWFFIEPEGLKPLREIPGLHELTLRVPGRSVQEILDVLRAVRASGLATKMHACLQQAGDLMYVPALWWHMTLNIGEAAGFSFQRYHLNHEEVYSNMGGSGTAHMRLAEQWEMEEKLDDAESELLHAIELEPLNWQFVSVLVRVQVRNKKVTAAKSVLIKAVDTLLSMFDKHILSTADILNILGMWMMSVNAAGGTQSLVCFS